MSKDFSKYIMSKALRFRLGEDGNLYGSISASSGEFYIAPEILALFQIISSAEEKLDLKKLTKKLNQHYEKILKNLPHEHEYPALLEDLAAAGLLIDPQQENDRYMQEDGFGNSWIQWAMLSDAPRTSFYENALKKEITPSSVVADVGAGSGLLSAMCLKLGAKKVYAIEETQMAKKIIPILNELKLPTNKEKFTLFQQNSFDVTLPKNITHVVSELFGNDPFGEGVILTLRNIAKHFPKQPVYIPQKVSVFFEFIDILEHPIKHRILAFQNLSQKKSATFANEFLKAAKKTLSLKHVAFPLGLSKSQFERISKPIQLGVLPLNPPQFYSPKEPHPLKGQKSIAITKTPQCVAGLLWFRVHLTDSQTLSSHCQEKDAAEHWSPMLILLEKNPKKGDTLKLQHELSEEETQMICYVKS